MGTTAFSDIAADRGRDELCREFARMLKRGAFTVRTRIVCAQGEPAEAWFYAHRARRWEKQPAKITEPELVAAIQATLAMLASTEHHDAWSTKQRSTADYCDTDIRFHRDELQHRLDDKLESELRGLLFGDRHDSKQDVRRSIRIRRKT